MRSALLVEDDEDVAQLLRMHLEWAGYAVRHLTTAEEAIASLDERSYELAVVDMKLPLADGDLVVRRLQASPRHRECPIVMATIVDPDDLGVRVDAVLAKPFSRGEVVAALRRAGAEVGGVQ